MYIVLQNIGKRYKYKNKCRNWHVGQPKDSLSVCKTQSRELKNVKIGQTITTDKIYYLTKREVLFLSHFVTCIVLQNIGQRCNDKNKCGDRYIGQQKNSLHLCKTQSRELKNVKIGK